MPLETFGKRLRVLRIDRDLSQIKLRDVMMEQYGVAIGETYISQLESSDRMPSLEVAAAMARALDVSLDYLGLIIDEQLSYKRTPSAEHYFSEQADEVAQIVDNLRPSQRELLLNFAKNIDMLAPSERQRERVDIMEMLESIERKAGRDVRREVERMMRSKGMLIDPDA
jgi:transcriptional regulator with XRE-family HTH domain